jgi:hypothetical protein
MAAKQCPPSFCCKGIAALKGARDNPPLLGFSTIPDRARCFYRNSPILTTAILPLFLRFSGFDEIRSLKRLAVRTAHSRARPPAVFAFRTFASNGGLMSWGVNLSEIYRQAATYVDRILRGAKPEDLPVQAPTKFDLVINLKTAKALGLEVPLSLQVAADEMIE